MIYDAITSNFVGRTASASIMTSTTLAVRLPCPFPENFQTDLCSPHPPFSLNILLIFII